MIVDYLSPPSDLYCRGCCMRLEEDRVGKYYVCGPCYDLHMGGNKIKFVMILQKKAGTHVGMDLVGNTGDAWHVNWTGWGVLRDLLTMLELPTEHMAGGNDG